MPWRKLVPQPRWLPRAAVMRPQRVVIWCFSLVLALTLAVGLRDLYTLRERVIASHQHNLALRAMGLEAAVSSERFRLSFVRDYARQLMRMEAVQARGVSDPVIDRAFAARDEPIWQMEVPLGDAPVIGVSPQALAGLPGFERHVGDLRADLFAARQLSHVLGLTMGVDEIRNSVTFISSNGFFVTYPPVPADKAPALLQRFASMPYYRDLLPDRNPGQDLRWAPPYRQFESTELRTTLSVPIYVESRFRGVVAVDVSLKHIQALLGAPSDDSPALNRYLMDSAGRLIAAYHDHLSTDLRWPDVLGDTWRDVGPQTLFATDGPGMRKGDGGYLFYQRLGTGQWMLLEAVSTAQLYGEVFSRISKPLLPVWIALPLLMWISVRLVSLLFSYYLALGDKLQKLAERDPLTDLANRRHFGDQFAQAAARRARDGSALSMLMLDIDYFKKVNDRWGHASGDHVLQRLATALRENMRAVDTPARLGGEEFAVLMPGATLAEARVSAERLRVALAAMPVEPAPDAPTSATQGDPGARIRFTVSIGVAEAGSDGGQTLDAMLATADRRLYAAKAMGRNRVCAEDARAGNAEAPPVAG